MLNNRGDKFEGQEEESEYHFSDEEVNYEVDTESAPTEASGEEKQGIFKRLTQSKRMLIGLGVFIILVFVSYKLITPSAPPVPTDGVITPIAQKGPMQGVAPTTMAAASSVAKTIEPPPIPGTTPDMPQMVQPTQQVAEQQQPPPIGTQTPLPQQESLAQQPPAPVMAPPSMPPPPSQQFAQPTAPVASPISAPTPMTTPVAAVPSTAPSITLNAPLTPGLSVPSTIPTAASYQPASQLTGVDAKIAILEANNQRFIAQMQADYVQRLNDFYNQNKQLQEQIQGLANRVTNMESQFNQVIQGLNRQQNQEVSGNAGAFGPQSQLSTPKLPYNVQAIIPGRAWLRSDNGETITVAEGDVLKNIGRVTKIDPYDGIVEINTGGKIVSLSYGNTG